MSDVTKETHAPEGSPFQVVADLGKRLLGADACSIYAVKAVGTGAPLFQFAGWAGGDTDFDGTDSQLQPSRDGVPWLGVTSYVAFKGVTVRDDVSDRDAIDVRSGSTTTTVRVDRSCCEIRRPGPILAAPLKWEGRVLGVIRVLRSAGRRPFSSHEETTLENLAPLFTLSIRPELGRKSLVDGLMGVARRKTEDEVVEEIAGQAVELVRAESQGAAVFLIDPDADPVEGEEPHPDAAAADAVDVFTFRAPDERKAEMEKKRYTAAMRGLTAHVLRKQEPLFSTNIQRDTSEGGRYEKLFHETSGAETDPGKTKGFMAVPIKSPFKPNSVVGVIRIASVLPNAFTISDLDTLEALAAQTTLLLERIWGRDALFQKLVDTHLSPMVAIDADGMITEHNRAVVDMFGLGEMDLRQSSVVETVYRDVHVAAATREALEEELRGQDKGKLTEHHTICYSSPTRTGARVAVPVLLNATTLYSRETGEPCGSVGILEDLRGPKGSWTSEITSFGEPGEGNGGQSIDARVRAELSKLDILEPDRRKWAVFIEGETGCGKELFAHEVHARVGRGNTFTPVNCASLKEDLLESELFGSVEGAFTGAVDRPGVFIESEGGTVFLDEVQELTQRCQAQLLRVLDGKPFRAVGGMKEIQADVQVVAASSVDLAEKGFRKDLIQRLHGIRVRIPSLKERRADIIFLADKFFRAELEQRGPNAPLTGFDTAVVEALLAHDWPGNVRELKRAIETAVGRHCKHTWDAADPRRYLLQARFLPEPIASARSAGPPIGTVESIALYADLAERVRRLEASLERNSTQEESFPNFTAAVRHILKKKPALRDRIATKEELEEAARSLGAPAVKKSRLHDVFKLFIRARDET